MTGAEDLPEDGDQDCLSLLCPPQHTEDFPDTSRKISGEEIIATFPFIVQNASQETGEENG